VFGVEGAAFAALDDEAVAPTARELGAGSEAAVPCWFCGDASFSLCVFGEDGEVCPGSTLALLAEAFVFGLRWKSESRSDLWRSVSCGEVCGFCCVVDEGKGAGETPAVRTSGA
jgi:hypothetical protein